MLGVLLSTGIVHGIASCAENAATAPPVPEAGEPADTGPFPAIPRCDAGAWCPEDLPASSPVSLNSIWGTGPDDVWIVGSPDTVLHWDGKSVAPAKLDTKQSIFGIWGSSNADLWAFSTSHSMWHSAGYPDGDAGWERASDDTGLNDGGFPLPVYGMWGTSASDVWAVGASITGYATGLPQASVLHCNGWNEGTPAWQPAPTSEADPPDIEAVPYNAICGAAGAIWIVGGGGKTRHTSGWVDGGAAWTPLNSGTSRDLYAAWCSPTGDVWAAGEAGTLRHFADDGTGYASADFDLPITTALRALWGSASDDVWLAGDSGVVMHWDGKAWSDEAAMVRGQNESDLFAIWGSSKNDVWIAGRSILFHGAGALTATEASR